MNVFVTSIILNGLFDELFFCLVSQFQEGQQRPMLVRVFFACGSFEVHGLCPKLLQHLQQGLVVADGAGEVVDLPQDAPRKAQLQGGQRLNGH